MGAPAWQLLGSPPSQSLARKGLAVMHALMSGTSLGQDYAGPAGVSGQLVGCGENDWGSDLNILCGNILRRSIELARFFLLFSFFSILTWT